MTEINPNNLPTAQMLTIYYDSVTKKYYTRTSGTLNGTIQTVGLSKEGRVTETTINDTTWTKAIATPITDCNQINIQNASGQTIKLTYDPATVGFVGMSIWDRNERQYTIQNNIVPYLKCESGTCIIMVEELA